MSGECRAARRLDHCGLPQQNLAGGPVEVPEPKPGGGGPGISLRFVLQELGVYSNFKGCFADSDACFSVHPACKPSA